MTYSVTVISRDKADEERWFRELRGAASGLVELRAESASEPGSAQVVFVDGTRRGLGGALEACLEGIDRRGRAVILVVDEEAGIPPALGEGRVDDVIVHPFRPLEVVSKLRHYQQILMWDEVSRLNESFAQVMEKLHDDLKLAERLQKARLPARFPEVKGFKIANRYLAGMRSGGDHCDLAESREGGVLSMVLTDSSSYGLSSAVLSVLMRVAMKLSGEESRSCGETVRRIQEELLAALGEKDRLSLFYGVLSRKDYRLRYLNLGTACALYAPPGKGFRELGSQGEAIRKAGAPVAPSEGELALEPEGRLVLASDGFVEAAGGAEALRELLDRHRAAEAADSLNDLVFRVKSAFTEPDDMPAQDCTAVIFDVDSRVIRLA